MTYEEAKRYVTQGEYARADEKILEALEKQIPKKPKKVGKHFECNCGVWLLYDDEIPNENDTYCPKCGQRITWSEEE